MREVKRYGAAALFASTKVVLASDFDAQAAELAEARELLKRSKQFTFDLMSPMQLRSDIDAFLEKGQ